jgi:hypothetical protein
MTANQNCIYLSRTEKKSVTSAINAMVQTRGAKVPGKYVFRLGLAC